MSAVDGIGSVVLETHNWGRAARFFTDLGFELDFETDHHSGQFRAGEGPTVFVVEIPEDRAPRMQVVLQVPDADAYEPAPALDVVSPFEDTHYGTREMEVRDPDGRTWTIRAPGKAAG